MTLGKLRSLLYKSARIAGDVQAARRGTASRRQGHGKGDRQAVPVAPCPCRVRGTMGLWRKRKGRHRLPRRSACFTSELGPERSVGQPRTGCLSRGVTALVAFVRVLLVGAGAAVGVVLCVAALLGCGGSDPGRGAGSGGVAEAVSDASPPDRVPAAPGGAIGFSHFVFEQVGDRVVTSLVEGPRDQQVRVPVSFPELVRILESDGPLPAELQMGRLELSQLVAELETVQAATVRYQDVEAALADGFAQTGGVVPNMGAHFVHEGRVSDGRLDPSEPEILLYAPGGAGGFRLVGTAFMLPREPSGPSGAVPAGDVHPDGFAGPLDNWHVHYHLCTLPAGAFRTLGRQECEAKDGVYTASTGWMIHAWVHDDNPLGVFSMWNPNVPPLFLGSAGIQATRGVGRPSSESHVDVAIQNFAYQEVEINAGDSVTWINADGVPHTVTSGGGGEADGGFDSSLLGPGQAFTHQFNEPGEFPFTCTLHPHMNGTVTVR